MKAEKIILDWLARYVDDVTTAEVDGEKDWFNYSNTSKSI